MLPALELEDGSPLASAPLVWAADPDAPAVLLLALLELAEPEDDDGSDGMGLPDALLGDEGDGSDGDDCEELLEDDGVDGMLLEELEEDEGMEGMLLLDDVVDEVSQPIRPHPNPAIRVNLAKAEKYLICIA